MYQSDIRVDGIGQGNTFNEMYQRFGRPQQVLDVGIGVWVSYYYEDYQNKEHEKSYLIIFKNDNRAKKSQDGRDRRDTKQYDTSGRCFRNGRIISRTFKFKKEEEIMKQM